MTTRLELYFDPVCPFAWIAAKWLREVETRRPLDLHFRVMSLAVLNESPEDPYEESRGLDSAWRPVRVAVALADQRGESALIPYFEDFGRRFHINGVRGPSSEEQHQKSNGDNQE